MNIAVLTAEGNVVVRPDTTRIKDSEDAYLPDFVDKVDWAPVVYTRVTKPGKSVALRFASRYFSTFGVGALLYPHYTEGGSAQDYARSLCLDRTSALNLQTCEDTPGPADIAVLRDGNAIFALSTDISHLLEGAVSEVTRYCSIRTGDLLAVELQPCESLCRRGDAVPLLSGTVNGQERIKLKVVL